MSRYVGGRGAGRYSVPEPTVYSGKGGRGGRGGQVAPSPNVARRPHQNPQYDRWQPYNAPLVPGGRGRPVAKPGPSEGKGTTSRPAPQQLAAPVATQQTQAATSSLQPDQSFTLKVRRVIDHQLRTPHRRYIPDKLVRVIAHWVTIPGGTLPILSQHVDVNLVTDEKEMSIPPPPTPEEAEGAVNARVILSPGVRKGRSDLHMVKRIDLIVMNAPGGKNTCAYGGLVRGGSDAEIIQQLISLVKEQSGMDLKDVTTWYKFLELQYRDGIPTIFFLPALWEAGDLTLLPQAKEETEEVEEEYEEEEVDEEALAKQKEIVMKRKEEERKREEERKKKEEEEKGEKKEGEEKEEEKGEKKEGEEEEKEEEKAEEGKMEEDEEELPIPMKKVKKSRTVERVKKTKVAMPQSFSLGGLLELKVLKTTHPLTTELSAAADALDEFMKREMAGLMCSHLRRLCDEESKKAEEAKAKLEEIAQRKRQREEEEVSRKKARKEHEEALRKKWADEDEGKTDDEKRESMIERSKILRELKEKHQEEDKKLQEQDKGEGAKKSEKFKFVVNQEMADSLGYFDRSSGFKLTGKIPRSKIENLLLCIDEDLTMEEIRSLMSIPQISKHAMIDYNALAKEKQMVVEEEGEGEKAAEGKDKANGEEEKQEDTMAKDE